MEKIYSKELEDNLSLSYKTIADFTIDIEFCYDKNGNYIYINPSFEKLLNYSIDDFIKGNISFNDIVHSEDRQKLSKYISDISTFDVYEDIELRLVRLDSSIMYASMSSQPIIDKNGNYCGRRTSIRDITNRKNREKQLIKLSTAIKQSPSIIMITDLKGNIEYVNAKFTKLTGYSEDEVIGKNPRILKSGKLNSVIYEKIWSLISSGNEWRGQFLNKKKNGELYWELASISPIIDDNGKIINYFKVSEDITEKKKVEKKLVNSIIETELFLNTTTDGIWGWNFKTKELFFSERFYTMLGYKPKDFKPSYEKWLQLVHPKDLEWAKKMAKSFLNSKQDIYEQEYRLKTKNGNYRWIRAKTRIVKRDEQGKALRLIGSHEDITYRKNQEKKINETKNKLTEIIDGTPIVIILVDNNCNIELWNREAERVTGISRKRAIGKSLHDLDIFDSPSNINEILNCLNNGKNFSKGLITIRGIQGRKRLFESSYYVLNEKYAEGILIFANDVTKDAEKYGKIIPGKGYFLQTGEKNEAIRILKHLMINDCNCLYISRMNDEEIFHSMELSKSSILNLNYADVITKNESLLDTIEFHVKEFCETSQYNIVYIDRIDYLLYQYSFRESLKLLYKLHEYTFKNHCILIIRVNPSLLTQEQLTAIKEEFQPIPSSDFSSIDLEEKLFMILEFINNKNESNSIISFKIIKKEFSIVDVTVKKRLDSLEHLGLIVIKQQGRMKTVYITEKGRQLLSKRNMV